MKPSFLSRALAGASVEQQIAFRASIYEATKEEFSVIHELRKLCATREQQQAALTAAGIPWSSEITMWLLVDRYKYVIAHLAPEWIKLEHDISGIVKPELLAWVLVCVDGELTSTFPVTIHRVDGNKLHLAK